MKGYHLTHTVARCEECEWENGWYLDAQRTGRNHHLKTGHRVVIEIGYFIAYEHKDIEGREVRG